jgi:hypothetical protein
MPIAAGTSVGHRAMDLPTPPALFAARSSNDENKPPINMGIIFIPKTATIVSNLGPNMINAANVAATGNASMPRRLIFPYPLIVAPDSYILSPVASDH